MAHQGGGRGVGAPGGGAGGGQRDGLRHQDRRPAHARDFQGLVVSDEWKKGNPNREVTYQKFVLEPVRFTTEFGAEKSDNKELQDCYDRMFALKKAIGTAKSANAVNMFEEASSEYA